MREAAMFEGVRNGVYRVALACALLVAISARIASAALVCKPVVTKPIVVVSPRQRLAGGKRAQPPITDQTNGFAWPDTPLGIVKVGSAYTFFGSDGGLHARQLWNGHPVGNGKYGSITTTSGTLDNPLGTGAPLDVSIEPNPDPAVNPNYARYAYMGGGPVYEVPPGGPYAGDLLATYHAELPNDALYAVLGLAASSDHGRHWIDLGEVVRLNQAYAPGLAGFEIGDGPLVLSPDGRFFYLFFPRLDRQRNSRRHDDDAHLRRASTRSGVARRCVRRVAAAHGAVPEIL
jgi:hypothetical protein